MVERTIRYDVEVFDRNDIFHVWRVVESVGVTWPTKDVRFLWWRWRSINKFADSMPVLRPARQRSLEILKDLKSKAHNSSFRIIAVTSEGAHIPVHEDGGWISNRDLNPVSDNCS
jgi:hypothetical protein